MCTCLPTCQEKHNTNDTFSQLYLVDSNFHKNTHVSWLPPNLFTTSSVTSSLVAVVLSKGTTVTMTHWTAKSPTAPHLTAHAWHRMHACVSDPPSRATVRANENDLICDVVAHILSTSPTLSDLDPSPRCKTPSEFKNRLPSESPSYPT